MLQTPKKLTATLRRELKAYRLVMKDLRTPRFSHILLSLAVGYSLMPFDLIPDWIPVIGHLDDLVIIPLLIYAVLKCLPEGLLDECRRKATPRFPSEFST